MNRLFPPTAFLPLCALATAALAGVVVRQDEPGPRPDEILARFSPAGCEIDEDPGTDPNGPGNAYTINIASDGDGRVRSGQCETLPQDGWKSVEILRPYNDADWEIEIFSGEGCNDPIGTYSKNGCYSQPSGTQIKSLRPHKR